MPRRTDTMAYTPQILAFSGSLRAGSYNTLLVKQAAEGALAAGAKVTMLSLRELDLPMFDEDCEAKVTLPAGGKKLKELMRAHDGMLIACPEYNGSISGALKNAIDWASRPEPDQPSLSCFAGKVVGLLSASPGALGGLRGLAHVRAILSHVQSLVLPEQFGLMKAHEAFDAQGGLKDEKSRAAARAVGGAVAGMIAKLRA